MRIFYTPKFKKNLLSIEEYLEKNYPQQASSTMIYVEEKIKDIAINNYLGREGRVQGTRELIFPKLPYCIVYKILESNVKIAILNIVHTSQKYP